jgi:O-antigen/teichoic acid export membrane protein
VTRAEDGARVAPSPFARDVLLSGATAALTTASVILVTGWLAAGLGPAAFAIYALSRRVYSAAAAVTPGPLGAALARAIAAAPGPRERDAYLCAGTLIGLGATLAIVAIGAAFPAFWADLLLSDARYAPELLALLALIAGNTIYMLVFARLRGTSEIGAANLWQLWVVALGPLIVAGLLARRAPVATILLLFTAVSLTALVPLLMWLGRAARAGTRATDLRQPLGALLRYSVPRVPGTAALAGMLALGPLLAPYVGDLREAGYLVAAQSVFRVAEVGTAGFGLVVLPKVSALQARRLDGFLRERVEDLVAVVLHLGMFVACQLAIWAPEILGVWLGSAYREAVPLIRVLLIALVPYLGYTLLRSVIDGIEERPVNVWNLYAAVACTALLSLALGAGGWGALGLALATATGFAVLGALTLVFLRGKLRIGSAHLHPAYAVALNVVAALATLGLRPVLVDRLTGPGALLVGAAVSAVLLVGYLVALRRIGVRWLIEVEGRLLRRGGSNRDR